MGHSSGAQLAAYLAIDERPLKTVGLSLAMFKGCVPVDADTFDIPAVIELATANRKAAGKPEPKYGHREIFGGKPELWTDYSSVTHVATGKGIPPFLILYDAAAPLTPDQAKRLEGALVAKGIRAKAFGAQNTNHGKINADLGLPDDPSTAELLSFLKSVLKK
jgi:acetyl esterase/lipase